MKMKKPVHAGLFLRRLGRMREHAKSDSVMWRIPPVVMLEVRCLQNAYWGGPWRVVWALFKENLWLSAQSFRLGLGLTIADWLGWTKLYWNPETSEITGHYRRHGRKCSGSPNCHNENCIDESVPRWFRRLFGWPEKVELVDV